jgi:VWFA-related protein
MKTRASLCLVLFVIFAAAAGNSGKAQNPAGGTAKQPSSEPAKPAAKAPALELTLPVAVVDKHGALVTNLTAKDFTLTDDGHPQTIKSLATQSPLPFWLGLVVDTGRAMNSALDSERKAAGKFVDQMLPADAKAGSQGNQIFLIHFDRQVELLTDDFVAAPGKLHHELDEMSTSANARGDQGPENRDDRQGGGPGGPPRNGRLGGASQQLYDAIWLAAGEIRQQAKGERRALIVFSDGVDSGSKETLNDAIDEADRAGAQIFTIYLKGEEERMQNGGPGGGRQGGMGGNWPGNGGGWPGGGGNSGGKGRGDSKGAQVDGKKIMQQIATRTGGQFFEAKKKDNLEEIYGLIANELHQQYLLVYSPDQIDPNGEYHKIALKTDKKDMTVITREGYYASSEK